MRYHEAACLKPGDAVTVKTTGQAMRVLETQASPKSVLIMLDDGNWYGHKQLERPGKEEERHA